MMSLTRRQREVYEAIRTFIDRHGYGPSIEEIRETLGLSSVATVHKHLKNLEQKGAIARQAHRGRSIELTGAIHSPMTMRAPLLGVVAAGSPIEAIEDTQEVEVPSDFAGRGDLFALRVSGESMIDEQIRDGDTILVERRETADDGQMVVALVDGSETTVKRLFREGDRVRLQPANARMAPMIYEAERVQVQGLVIGLLRKY